MICSAQRIYLEALGMVDPKDWALVNVVNIDDNEHLQGTYWMSNQCDENGHHKLVHYNGKEEQQNATE